MSWRRVLVPLLLVVPCTLAQFQHLQKNGSVRVRIVFADGSPSCNPHVRVTLWTKATSIPLAQIDTGDDCRAEFSSLLAGDYYVAVSGIGIESTESPSFEVGDTSQSVEVRTTARQPSPTVSVLDLNIPSKARKEFERASAQIAKNAWNKALEHLQKAVAIYPQYAAAYNNLGVAYAHLGDRDLERAALHKAVSLNDHFAPALTNLARMAIVDRNLPEAEAMLSRATAVDPNDLQVLVLLAKLQLLNRHFEEAIASCHKVHSMQHSSLSLVHYIAARALEGENRPADAVSELHTFLDEEPSGPGAEAARKELAVLENRARLSANQR
ncbi:MAG: tetratricopeptide repeat protein [Acidobacteriia bacterium]|nr:tetratricopeptide repeat protein [Terriglobia bacterium]